MDKQILPSPNEIEKAKDMDKSKSLEDVLARSVGKWGWFQVWFGVIIYLYESACLPACMVPCSQTSPPIITASRTRTKHSAQRSGRMKLTDVTWWMKRPTAP